jgi:hypothetical protein
MADIQVQLRRGTTTQHGSFTGAVGEVTVDTDLDTLRVHDGSTVGGVRLAKHSELSGAGSGGTVTEVDAGTGLETSPASGITTTGTIGIADGGVGETQLASDAVTSDKLAAGAVTHDKISTTDPVFKINSNDQIRIGGDLNNAALEAASQFGITSSTGSILTVESTGTTNATDDATMVLMGAGNATLQFNDTSEAPNSTGVWNTSSINGAFEIGSLGISPSINLTGCRLVRKTLSGTDFIVPSFGNLPTFANNSTATSGGLATNDVYKTSTGELRIVV